MPNATGHSIATELREKPEKLLGERFCFTDLEQPVMKALFESGMERAERDMLRNPQLYEDIKETPGKAFSNQALAPLGPLQLLVDTIKLPALPQVLIELFRVINDSKSSAEDLAAIIGLDTSLSSYLLRMVNSAYYSFPFPIDTVTRAVTLIGTREISTLAFSTSFLSMFKETAPDVINMELFWKHSIACGITARALAQRCGKKNPDRHFVAGLLHDIGRLVLFSNLPDLAKALLAEGREKGLLLHEAENQLLGYDHGRFGSSLLNKWNFPSTLVAAVQHHHCPDMAKEFDEPGTVHVADIITKALGIGKSGEFHVPPMAMETWEGLGLSAKDLVLVIEELEGELEKTLGLLIGAKGFKASRKD